MMEDSILATTSDQKKVSTTTSNINNINEQNNSKSKSKLIFKNIWPKFKVINEIIVKKNSDNENENENIERKKVVDIKSGQFNVFTHSNGSNENLNLNLNLNSDSNSNSNNISNSNVIFMNGKNSIEEREEHKFTVREKKSNFLGSELIDNINKHNIEEKRTRRNKEKNNNNNDNDKFNNQNKSEIEESKIVKLSKVFDQSLLLLSSSSSSSTSPIDLSEIATANRYFESDKIEQQQSSSSSLSLARTKLATSEQVNNNKLNVKSSLLFQNQRKLFEQQQQQQREGEREREESKSKKFVPILNDRIGNSNISNIKAKETSGTSGQVEQENSYLYAANELVVANKSSSRRKHVPINVSSYINKNKLSSSSSEVNRDRKGEEDNFSLIAQVNPLVAVTSNRAREASGNFSLAKEFDYDEEDEDEDEEEEEEEEEEIDEIESSINQHHLHCNRRLHLKHICGFGGSHKDQLNHLAARLSSQQREHQTKAHKLNAQVNNNCKQVIDNNNRSTFLFGAPSKSYQHSSIFVVQPGETSEDSIRSSSASDLQPLARQEQQQQQQQQHINQLITNNACASLIEHQEESAKGYKFKSKSKYFNTNIESSQRINQRVIDQLKKKDLIISKRLRRGKGKVRRRKRKREHSSRDQRGLINWLFFGLLSKFKSANEPEPLNVNTTNGFTVTDYPHQHQQYPNTNTKIMYTHNHHHHHHHQQQQHPHPHHPHHQFGSGQLGQPGSYYLSAASGTQTNLHHHSNGMTSNQQQQLHNPYGQSILSDSSMSSSSAFARSANRLTGLFGSCCSKKCLIVFIMLLILIIFIFVTGLSAYLNFLTNLSRSNLVPLSGRLKIETQGDTFNEQLANRTSKEFQLKQIQYETILRGAFDRTQIQMKNYPNHLVKCEVYSFKPGSLWVYFRLFINKRSLQFDQTLMKRKSPDELLERQFLPRLTQQTLLAGFEQLVNTLSNSSSSSLSLSLNNNNNNNMNQRRASRSSIKDSLSKKNSSKTREDHLKSFDEQIIRLMPIIESIDLQSIQVTSEFDMLANQQLQSISDNLRAPQPQTVTTNTGQRNTNNKLVSSTATTTSATSISDNEIPTTTTTTTTTPTTTNSNKSSSNIQLDDKSSSMTSTNKKFTLQNYKENQTRPNNSTNLGNTNKKQQQQEEQSPFLTNHQVRKPISNSQSSDKLIKLVSGQPVISQHKSDTQSNINAQLKSNGEQTTQRISKQTTTTNKPPQTVTSTSTSTSVATSKSLDGSIQDLWSNAISGNKRNNNNVTSIQAPKQRQTLTIINLGNNQNQNDIGSTRQGSLVDITTTSSTQRPPKVSPHQHQGGAMNQGPIHQKPQARLNSALVLNRDIITFNATQKPNDMTPKQQQTNRKQQNNQTSTKPKSTKPKQQQQVASQNRTRADIMTLSTFPSTIDLTRSTTVKPMTTASLASSSTTTTSTTTTSTTTSKPIDVVAFIDSSPKPHKPDNFRAALMNAQTTRPGTSSFSGQWKPIKSSSIVDHQSDSSRESTRVGPTIISQIGQNIEDEAKGSQVVGVNPLQGSQSPFAMPLVELQKHLDQQQQQQVQQQASLAPLRSHRHNSTQNRRINKLSNTYQLLHGPTSNGANGNQANDFESHRVSRMRVSSNNNNNNNNNGAVDKLPVSSQSSSSNRLVDDFFISVTTNSASKQEDENNREDESLAQGGPRRTQDPFAFDTLHDSHGDSHGDSISVSSTTPLSFTLTNTNTLIRKRLTLSNDSIETTNSMVTEPTIMPDPLIPDQGDYFGSRQLIPSSSSASSQTNNNNNNNNNNNSSSHHHFEAFKCQYYGCKAKDSSKFTCLNHSQICDDFIDCNDESDELDCVSLLRHDSKSNRLSFSNGAGIVYLNRRGSLAPMCIDYPDQIDFSSPKSNIRDANNNNNNNNENSNNNQRISSEQAQQVIVSRKRQELIRQINTIGQYACSLQSFSRLVSVKINHHDLVDDMNLMRNSKIYHRLSILGELDKRDKGAEMTFESYKSGSPEHEVEVSTSSECPSQRTVFVKCGSFECGQDSFSVINGKGSSKIKGGVINDFPWLVKLFWLESLSCHGYLIDEMWLIASSECFVNNKSNPSDWTAEISYEHYGNDDYQSIESNRRSISDIMFQPQANEDNSMIVLAKLERPVRFSPLNRPICLPLPSTNRSLSNDSVRTYKDCVTATLPLVSNNTGRASRQDLLLSKVKFHKTSDCLNGSIGPLDLSSFICLTELSGPSSLVSSDDGFDNQETDSTRVLICSNAQESRSNSKWTVVGFQRKLLPTDQFELNEGKQLFSMVASQIDWIVDAMNPKSNNRNPRSENNGNTHSNVIGRTSPNVDETNSRELFSDILNQRANINILNTQCNQFKCSTGECLSWSRICDGLYDCSSHEDENDCH